MKKFIVGKWLGEEEIIDFLIEKVFQLQVRIDDLEKSNQKENED